VFQHQLLQERAARLELEQLKGQAELDRLREERSNVQRELRTLNEELEREKLKRDGLSDEIGRAHEKERAARRRAELLKQEVEAETAALTRVRWSVLSTELTIRVWAHNETLISKDARDSETFEEYLQSQRSSWPDPYAVLVSVVDGLEHRGDKKVLYTPEMVAELRTFISNRRFSLSCPEPNFAAIAERYHQEEAKLSAIVQEKTEAFIAGIVEEYEKRGELVKITDEFREAAKGRNQTWERLALDSRFRKEVSGQRARCLQVLFDVVGELEGLKTE
jgi:hypothetical protein